MTISVRARFEVFKRDEFTCHYCGRTSPAVVLEVDHVVPIAAGGIDDPINLITSCWECNRGKGAVPLADVMTGEDPHDRAILMLERERQLREYNAVLAEIDRRVEQDVEALLADWPGYLEPRDRTWLRNRLRETPASTIREAMRIAIDARRTSGFGYVSACLRNWRERGTQQ